MMMFVVVQKMIHVHEVDEVDGVDGWLLPVGEDVVEVVVLSLVPQDSALLRNVGYRLVIRLMVLESIEE